MHIEREEADMDKAEFDALLNRVYAQDEQPKQMLVTAQAYFVIEWMQSFLGSDRRRIKREIAKAHKAFRASRAH